MGLRPRSLRWRRRPAEIVFSDVIMPLHDGLWLAKKLRERWPDTVIVAVSGALEVETVVKMRKFGAIDYVTEANRPRDAPPGAGTRARASARSLKRRPRSYNCGHRSNQTAGEHLFSSSGITYMPQAQCHGQFLLLLQRG